MPRIAIVKRLPAMIAAIACLCVASLASASQEEFFKGLGGELGGGAAAAPAAGGQAARFLALAGLAVGLLVLVAWLIQLRKAAALRSVNHPGKLVREVTKKVGLKPAQLKKLKPMAEEADVSSPLVLLLCPSLMAETMKKTGSQRAAR